MTTTRAETTTHMAVSLSLVHPKGSNIAGRYWPHSGHLGLTPLSISGIVRLRKDSSDTVSHPNSNVVTTASTSSSASTSQPIRAAAVTVSLRCYEAKLGRVGVVRTNILFEHTVSLWSATASSTIDASPSAASSSQPTSRRSTGASDQQQPVVADLAQTEFPFHITVPPASAGGCSTCHLQSYRVYWRLESSKYSSILLLCSPVPFHCRWHDFYIYLRFAG